MSTTRVSFTTTTKIKTGAMKRARAEGTTLTAVLNRAMILYAQGVFNPNRFRS